MQVRSKQETQQLTEGRAVSWGQQRFSAGPREVSAGEQEGTHRRQSQMLSASGEVGQQRRI